MNMHAQIDALDADLKQLLARYADEFDLPYAAIVGVLQMAVIETTLQSAEPGDDEMGLTYQPDDDDL